MTDLITRLEQAKEGSRELSDEVLLALGWKTGIGTHADFTKFHAPDGSPASRDRPDPTTNLQDAVDLVPERHPWTLDSIGIVEMGSTTGKPVEGIARTLALAMCIAILKVQEAEDD